MASSAMLTAIALLTVLPTYPTFGDPYTQLHVFKGADGTYPDAGLTAFDGVLFGTDSEGGAFGRGTVFAIGLAGKFRVEHSFRPKGDGSVPMAPIVAWGGALYGTTSQGGASGCGTVFKMTKSGEERIVYSFKEFNSDGCSPESSLVAIGGSLYGTTVTTSLQGDNQGYGTVFAVTPAGKKKTLHIFTGLNQLGQSVDGAFPYSGLVALKGLLYGTTSSGGANNLGTAYSITTNGIETAYSSDTGAWGPMTNLLNDGGVLFGTAFNSSTIFTFTPAGVISTIYRFATALGDGSQPLGALINVNGTLYGTTGYGGGTGCSNGDGCGTIFSISPQGIETILYRFQGGKDGALPAAGLTYFSGKLFGTTQYGGDGGCLPNGCGTIYSFVP